MDMPLPKDFMKERRPDRFSDSRIVTESKLNRSMLEYILESLGARNKEKNFEEFARKLCQHEICPNLRPQTGSTAGGDSKADSETVPVSSQTQLAFFQGTDNQSKGKFAFAVSTSKDWSGKIRCDAEELSKTSTDWERVYFITSRDARDKTRALLEDELKKYDFESVIIDKNWILDAVFKNNREIIAIEELGLGDGLEEKKEIGVSDYQKKKYFEELKESIDKDVSEEQVSLTTVSESLDMALLAAELDQPSPDVTALFDRAIRFAKEYGTSDQHFTAVYQKVWTLYFWFNDFDALLNTYEEVEKLALESINIFSVERLNNLWTVLYTLSFTSDRVNKEFLKQKTKNLDEKLTEMRGNESNQSASVQAEAMVNFKSLTQNRGNPEEVTRVFKELKKVIDKAEHLIGFPFKTTFQILDEINDVFSGNEGFEELQEHLVKVVTKRDGDIAAGEMLLNRGIQHLKADRVYEAIDFLGRALIRFHKKESKRQLVISLAFLSMAYEDAGLLWAARGALLNAASHATSDFWTYGEINTMQLSCYKRLRTIELLLGRIGYALEWHRLHHTMAVQLAKTQEEKTDLLDKDLYFGSLMGLLLIKTPEERLSDLEKLPDTLTSMDLDFAAFGLMYRLGGKDALPESFLSEMSETEVEKFFSSYLSQPAQEQLPSEPLLYEDDTVELKSTILGCDFIVKAQNSSPEIEIAEYILSALESFLSTTIERGAASIDGTVHISVNRDESLGAKVTHKINKGGKLGIEIECGNFNPHSLTKDEQHGIHSNISKIVLQIVANTAIFKDPEADLVTLFRDEEVSSRAFSFSSPMVTLGNLLGYQPKRKISDWLEDGSQKYEYNKEKSGPLNKAPKMKNDNESDIDRHDQIKNLSVIRQHLWDDAGWTGAAYLVMPDRPPVLAFMYTNKDNAKAIFKDWQETYGKEDKDEIIRISMVRGISEKNPEWYRAVVTTNLDEKNPPKGKVITASRLHTMTPDTSENLDRFSKSFKEYGFYLLAPAFVVDIKSQPEIFFDHGIVKRSFEDRCAWEIGPNDLDIAAVRTDDGTKPIIPKNVKDAPILKIPKYKK